MGVDWAAGFAWALDFCRALNERPRWARTLFKFAVGRWAYREYQGLVDRLSQEGFDPTFEYGLEDMSYHGEAS